MDTFGRRTGVAGVAFKEELLLYRSLANLCSPCMDSICHLADVFCFFSCVIVVLPRGDCLEGKVARVVLKARRMAQTIQGERIPQD